jgi:hypothetical protein
MLAALPDFYRAFFLPGEYLEIAQAKSRAGPLLHFYRSEATASQGIERPGSIPWPDISPNSTR